MTYQLSTLVAQLAVRAKDTNLSDLLTEKAEILQTYLYDVITQFDDLYSIDTAYGIWLDYVGYRLGIFSRPAIPSEPINVLGMVYGRDAFGVKPFAAQGETGDTTPLSDDLFRKFLKVRARALISDCTIDQMREDYLLFFDQPNDTITLIDEQDMTLFLNIRSDLPYVIVKALYDNGMFYKPAGVALDAIYNPNVSGSMVYGQDAFGSKAFGSFF